MFLLSAFIPTVVLVLLSYHRVVKHLEEQSFTRIKRETKAYSLGLYDRMIRLTYELESLGERLQLAAASQTELSPEKKEQLHELFSAIVIYQGSNTAIPLLSALDLLQMQRVVGGVHLAGNKPFAVALPMDGKPATIYFGVNFFDQGEYRFSVIGQAQVNYLWGVGHSPLLPPATELTVYNGMGQNIMSSGHSPAKNYRDVDREFLINDDHQLFTYQQEGETYYASFSNLFFESRFQPTSWTISLAQGRQDIMSSLAEFRATFPFIVLFFLLLILYLSFSFIRRRLEPLQELKKGIRRIAVKNFTEPVEIHSRDEFEDLGKVFNTMCSQLQQQFNTLEALAHIDRSILSSVNKVEIVNITLQQLKAFFAADICIYARNSVASTNHVKLYVTKGRRRADARVIFQELSSEERELLFGQELPAVNIDETGDLGAVLESLTGDHYASCIALPVRIDEKAKRTIILGWLEERELADEALGQARQIVDQLAVGLTKAYLVEDLERLAVGTIEALARTVDAKSKWTAGHSERVASLSGKIARVLRFSEQECNALTRAALLHDIGKIGVPLAILDKPDRLTDAEYAEVKRHPEIGGEILEPIEAYHDLIPVIVQHHEKYDGSGYPQGLAGENIDLRARILAVADVWDAVVSNRPYREGWVAGRARQLILDGAGSHFDPKVVDAFLTVVAQDE